MQESHDFFLDTFDAVSEDEISSLLFPLLSWDRIFFFGDLGSGKSTFIRALLRSHFADESLIVRSPTYTYYQKYGRDIYHFDLYRVESLDNIFLIGAMDIFENPRAICLIEWPEILTGSLRATKKISLSQSTDGTRTYTIESLKREH